VVLAVSVANPNIYGFDCPVLGLPCSLDYTPNSMKSSQPVCSDYHNIKLYRFIRKKYKNIPLNGVFRLIRKGCIKVDGKRKRPEYLLKRGDVVQLYLSVSEPVKPFVDLSEAERVMVKKSIVYDRGGIIICNKPPALVMHRGSGHKRGFVEMVQAYTINHDFTFVNRIDKDSSGLVIGAKKLIVARKLSELFRNGEIEKYYSIMADGLIKKDKFRISSYLRKDTRRVREDANGEKGGKKSVSLFRVVRRYPRNTLLEARILTGRTHQLRVQLAELGYPVVGDVRYGKSRCPQMFLFSRRLVIGEFNIDISLDLPDFFTLFKEN
jgi:23S rRNA pseudouridine955/2504/2580 synthase